MFLKKYKFPLNLFIILDKVKPLLYTSKHLSNNHYICILPKNYYFLLNLILKKELFLNFLFLNEISSIDTSKYFNFQNKLDFFCKTSNIMLYNIYYFYFIKLKLTIFYNISSLNDGLDSIELLFKNSNWLERENSEMYKINYLNKIDNRSLLLDYSRNEYPLLKNFPCEGFEEIYFNFFENKVSFIKNEFIEL